MMEIYLLVDIIDLMREKKNKRPKDIPRILVYERENQYLNLVWLSCKLLAVLVHQSANTLDPTFLYIDQKVYLYKYDPPAIVFANLVMPALW